MSCIQSLPPSAEAAELFPVIGAMDPECIVEGLTANVPRRMLAWLKVSFRPPRLASESDINPIQKIPSVPRDLIKLWEDYEYMAMLEKTVKWGSPTGSYPFVKRVWPYSPEFLRILVSLVMFQPYPLCGLSKLCGRLDLTWTKMRSSICDPSSTIWRDEHGLPGLPARQAFRDVALQCIRQMVRNHLYIGGQVYPEESRDASLESMGRYQTNDEVTEEGIYKNVDHRRKQ